MTDSNALGARAVRSAVRVTRRRRLRSAASEPAASDRTAPPDPDRSVDSPAAARPVTAFGVGMTVAGRYRLLTLVYERVGTQFWRAMDEVLDRRVGLIAVARSDPRSPALLTAARRAATVSDPHFLRVYDAGTWRSASAPEVTFVVQEWVTARSLTNLLAGGPLDPHRAALLSRELAEAVAAAHAEGLTHRMLGPDRILVAANGAVRVVGLGTAAALAAPPDALADPTTASARDRLADVRAVGAVFYASLTGRWPARPVAARPVAARPVSLLPAATRHDRVLGPRQIRPGIPRAHDALALRCLGRDGGLTEGPISSARELAGLLGEVTAPAVDANAPLSPLRDLAAGAAHPVSEPATSGNGNPDEVTDERSVPGAVAEPWPAAGSAAGPGSTTAGPQPVPTHDGRALPAASVTASGRRGSPVAPGVGRLTGRASGPSRGVRPVAGALVGLFGLGAVLLVWQAVTVAGDAHPGAVVVRDARVPAGGAAAGDAGPLGGVVGLPVHAISEFDPAGSDARPEPSAALAVDGDPRTAWRTLRYPTGGGRGVGLLLDLGRVRTVSGVDVALVGSGSVELRSPGIAASPPPGLDAYGVLTRASSRAGEARLRAPRPVLARYLVVWLTNLPPDGGGFRGGIRTITVHG